ncbi:unnamed protein product [Coffea canephora]|uniref:FAD-binding PCMH-type domain-containing protein n=1 Tax=Coffea canephora TaxID=49390 RepID=A0A068UWR8_COFCA|nr:unnamed protein product [Coffea canephora]
MGSRHALKSLVLIPLFVLVTCNAFEDFLHCISTSSKENIEKYIHKPNSPEYSSLLKYAQKISRWSNSTSAFPLFIVTPYHEAQMRSIILCSKKLGLQVRVKSGGHDYEGLSYRCRSPFIMIDLCNLKSINIDLESETAWIQTGVTLGQLYYAIAQKSKTHAFAGGLCPTVGSGGHISGGGIGTLLRKYGLAADNVVDARVMDANGQILDSKEMGEDLFWAIRGGGGASFGVILAWKLKLSRVPEQVTAFTIRRKLDRNNIKLIQRWQNIAHQFPEDLFVRMILQNQAPIVKGGEKIVQISFQGLYLGTADKLVTLSSRYLPEFGIKVRDCFQDPTEIKNCKRKPCIKKECYQVPWIKSALYFASKIPKSSLQYLVSKRSTPAYYKAKSDFVTRPIPEKAWVLIKKMFLEEDSPMMILDPFGGRMSQICESKLPFPHRNGTLYNIQYLVNWKYNNQSESNKHIEWIRRLHKKMEPFVSQYPRAAYINYRDLDLGVNGEEYKYEEAKTWGEMYFKDNFEKLARIKSKVDPSNFFRNEQSIPLLF